MRTTVLLVLLLACSPPLAPPDGRPLVPDPAWAALATDVEQCVGRRGHLERLTWRVTDAVLRDSTGAELEAQWWPSHTIYLRARILDTTVVSPWYRDRVIRHELEHELRGTGEHPAGWCTP